MSTQATVTSTFQPVHNAKVPAEGPKAIPLRLDFTATQSLFVDLTQQQQQAKISFIQGAFVDNSLNGQPVTINTGNSQQSVVIPPYSQAYVPLLIPNPPTFTASTTGGVVVPVVMLNIPMDIAIWSTTQGFKFTANGYLETSDVALDALISGGALSVADINLAPLITNQGGGNGLDVNIISGAGTSNPNRFFTTQFNGGTNTVVAGVAGNYLYVDSLTVLLDPLAYAGAAGGIGLAYIVNDSGDTLADIPLYVPNAAATYSTPQGAIQMLNLRSMGYKSAQQGASLILYSSGNLSDTGITTIVGCRFSTT